MSKDTRGDTGLALPQKEREVKYIKAINYLEYLPTESDFNKEFHRKVVLANAETIAYQDPSFVKNDPYSSAKKDNKHENMEDLNMDDKELAKAIE